MKVAVFSAKSYDREFLNAANVAHHHDLHYLEVPLNARTAALAQGFPAVCAFVNDMLDRPALEHLKALGVRLVALRSSGFSNVDLIAAAEFGLPVVRVPAYSPYAVAEHAVALMLALNRKLCRAFGRVRDGNFELEGLLGFDMNGRTVGVIGTGRVGAVAAKILKGFGCRLLGYDPYPNAALADLLEYVSLEVLYPSCDIITLHVPLTPETHHMIREESLSQMRRGAMLVNTSRGGLIDTPAVIEALKSGQLSGLGLDVYEEEAHLFFRDLSDQVIQDDVFARLLTFPNALITAHQAFFTRDALDSLAHTTMENISEFERTGTSKNEVHADRVKSGRG